MFSYSLPPPIPTLLLRGIEKLPAVLKELEECKEEFLALFRPDSDGKYHEVYLADYKRALHKIDYGNNNAVLQKLCSYFTCSNEDIEDLTRCSFKYQKIILAACYQAYEAVKECYEAYSDVEASFFKQKSCQAKSPSLTKPIVEKSELSYFARFKNTFLTDYLEPIRKACGAINLLEEQEEKIVRPSVKGK